MKLSIVIPSYNEEAIIRAFHVRLKAVLKELTGKGRIDDYEVFYVDDGSEDDTLALLKALASEDRRIKVISLSANFGHQSALTAGLYHATGDAVVSLDADLQDPPETIEAMLARFREGFEIVYGVRRSRKGDSLFRRLTARGFYRAMRMMGVRLIDNHADFRLMSRRALEEFKQFTETNRFLRGIIPLMGFRHSFVEYEREKRPSGESKYPIPRMASFAIDGITSFSYFPLRIASIIGMIASAVSVFLLLWTLATKLSGDAIPGWASTVIPIYLFGGIQLLFLGVIGEYIGKIFMEVKRRPLFIIKETCNLADKE